MTGRLPGGSTELGDNVALSDYDRNLIPRCLGRVPRAWEDFVDRFLGLVVHVVQHSAQSRSIKLTSQDVEDLVAEVFVGIVSDDYAVLRRFREQSSLATYLTVVARRIVVRELLKRKTVAPLSENVVSRASANRADAAADSRLSSRDEVEQLLKLLQGPEAEVVRLYHLEGRTYQEISSQIGMPENSIGPTLSRARAKLRQAGVAR